MYVHMCVITVLDLAQAHDGPGDKDGLSPVLVNQVS